MRERARRALSSLGAWAPGFHTSRVLGAPLAKTTYLRFDIGGIRLRSPRGACGCLRSWCICHSILKDFMLRRNNLRAQISFASNGVYESRRSYLRALMISGFLRSYAKEKAL